MSDVISEFLKQHNINDTNHPLYDMNTKYFKDFQKILKLADNNLSGKYLKRIISKFNSCINYEPYNYAQEAVELSFIAHILRKYNDEFQYEPKYNEKKNPECSFKCGDRIINIEVKCPDCTKFYNNIKDKNILIKLPNRFFPKEKIEELNDINCNDVGIVDLLDNKLKDYVESAHAKFPSDNDKYFNILIIGLPNIDMIDEWLYYITGICGLFEKENFIPKEYLSNIHAIMLSDVAENHLHEIDDRKDNWDILNNVNIVLKNLYTKFSSENDVIKCREFFDKYVEDMFGKYTKLYNEFLLIMKNQSNHDFITMSQKEYSFKHNFIKTKLVSCMIDYYNKK